MSAKGARTRWFNEIKKLEAEASVIHGKISKIREKLKANCPHEPENVKDYKWEHDNGYGVQKMITGERCTTCGAYKGWKGSGSWNKK